MLQLVPRSRRVYGDRQSPDIAVGHLVWVDSSLGNQDVWEMDLRR